MANSGSIWGGQLLVRRCPEFRSLAYEDQCHYPLAQNLPFFWCYFWKVTAWLTSMILLPTPLSFLTFFLLFGAFELAAFWQCIFFFLQNEPIYFYSYICREFRLSWWTPSFLYLKLDRLSRLSSLTGFHSLIYNMKFKNDQIRIKQSNLSCICGIKDKLHTNVILQ